MKTNQNKSVIDFLEKHKEINKTNVSLLDKEITEEKIYELRAYTQGKLLHLSFGHSIKGWTDQNGVIIANSKPVRKTPAQKESDMGSTWTKPQQQYLDNMKNEINQKIDDNHNEVKSEINQLKTDINLLTSAIKELTVSLTKHINDHK